MVGRIIALIAISSILALVTNMHGPTYGNLMVEKSDIKSKQIERFYPIASLINNQTTNKEIMTELKSQIENSDPFKVRGADKDTNTLNLTSKEGTHSNDANSKDVSSKDANSKDANSNDANSKDVSSKDDNGCKSDCPEKSKPTRDKIPFELPSIPFP
ncbi:MAG: hypothetical protein ACRD97_00630 [Nitrososphaeraceae archaeon]